MPPNFGKLQKVKNKITIYTGFVIFFILKNLYTVFVQQ